jgi:hypothetical protein
MKQLMELAAVQICTAIQKVCANLDFEILALPGGSLIAVLLWLCTGAAGCIRRAAAPICISE